MRQRKPPSLNLFSIIASTKGGKTNVPCSSHTSLDTFENLDTNAANIQNNKPQKKSMGDRIEEVSLKLLEA